MILTALPPFVRGSGSWSKNNEFPKPNYIINLYYSIFFGLLGGFYLQEDKKKSFRVSGCLDILL